MFTEFGVAHAFAVAVDVLEAFARIFATIGMTANGT